MTFKKVKALFESKHTQGSIWKDKKDYTGLNNTNVFKVCYNTNGKVYTYRVHNLTALMIRLGLKEEPTPIIEETLNIEEFNKNEFGIKI